MVNTNPLFFFFLILRQYFSKTIELKDLTQSERNKRRACSSLMQKKRDRFTRKSERDHELDKKISKKKTNKHAQRGKYVKLLSKIVKELSSCTI